MSWDGAELVWEDLDLGADCTVESGGQVALAGAEEVADVVQVREGVK